jgi:hypothetical protein
MLNLADLVGYFERNTKKLNANETKNALYKIKQIEKILERNLKIKGVV